MSGAIQRQLHIIASTDPRSGGPIELLLNSAFALHKLGHSVEIASLDHPASPWLNDFPIKVHALGPSTRPYSYSGRLTPWLDTNSVRYDIVVIHGLWNYSSLGTHRSLKRGKLPYIIFAHGMLDPWFKHAYPVKHLMKQIYWSLFEGRVLQDASAVLFTAEEERLLATRAFYGYRYHEEVVALGTNDISGDSTDQIMQFRAAFPKIEARRFLLFLSRIHPKKGCDMLIESFGRIAATLAPDLDLVIAGPDQTGWRPTLEKLAEQAGVAERIHWTGMLTGDLKWGAFHACEAFVLPSHQENFGIVIAEALACGKPVLITNKINIWREIEFSASGFVANDDVESITRMLESYISLSTDDRLAMARRSREVFLDRFHIDQMAKIFASICQTIISDHRGALPRAAAMSISGDVQ